MSLVLEPFADTELVLCGTEESGLLLGVLTALRGSVRGTVWSFADTIDRSNTYVVEAEKNLALSRGRSRQRSHSTELRESSARRGTLSEQRAGGASEVDSGACKYHCECVKSV